MTLALTFQCQRQKQTNVNIFVNKQSSCVISNKEYQIFFCDIKLDLRKKRSVLRKEYQFVMGKICSKKSKSTAKSGDPVESKSLLETVEIAPELIEHILLHVDMKTLLNCRRVCKCWNEIITTKHFWRKSAEIKTGSSFAWDSVLEWRDFYLICSAGLFNRNLVKNHSGERKFERWKITQNNGDSWTVERPLSARSLPKQSGFDGKQHCFVNSCSNCYKHYTIDLIEEGFTANILDHLRPAIQVSTTPQSNTCKTHF